MYELEEGQITIFRNEKAQDKQPLYKGTAKLNSKLLEIALWVWESKEGKKYFNGKIKSKGTPIAVKEEKEDNDDLPF